MIDKTKTVAVIGAVGIDIFGTADNPVIPMDSNPGNVRHSFGGVGRNIANNLSKLGIDVELVAAIGDDDNANKIYEHCKAENIGLNHCFNTKGSSPIYLSINQPDGDIYTAIADFSLVDKMNKDFLARKMDFFNSCAIVVIDTNLNVEILNYLFNNIKTKIYVDPVSTTKAKKLINLLDKISVLKPNIIEAETLVGAKLNPQDLVKELEKSGVKEVYLTLGKDGVCFKEQHLNNYPGNIVNTTGCGDAFLAGVIYGDLLDYDQTTKAKCGLVAASICAASENSISENLSAKLIKEKIWDWKNI